MARPKKVDDFPMPGDIGPSAKVAAYDPARVTVPLGEVAGLVGGRTDHESWFEQQGFSKRLVFDWKGDVHLPVEIAAEAAAMYRRYRDEYEERMQAYARYLSEKEAEAERARREAWQREQERYEKERAAASDYNERENAEKQRQYWEQVARETAARRGKVVDFTEFIEGKR